MRTIFASLKEVTHTVFILDNQISHLLKTFDYLRSKGYNVVISQTISDFHNQLNGILPHAILINLDIDGSDGITLMNDLKSSYLSSNPYCIIYSDKQDDYIQQLAYDKGADAFISFYNKPVLLELFLSNLLKRLNTEVSSIPIGKMLIDEEHFCVKLNGNNYSLPRKEFNILKLFMRTPHIILSKLDIARILWNNEQIAGKRTIDVHIYNIRKVLGQHVLLSVKGKGYVMNQKYL